MFHIEDVEGVEPLADDDFNGNVQRFDDDADAEEVMEEEEPLLMLEEKREVLNMTEINNDTAIMNTTIIAIGISEVLAYILIKRKRHHRFRFYR